VTTASAAHVPTKSTAVKSGSAMESTSAAVESASTVCKSAATVCEPSAAVEGRPNVCKSISRVVESAMSEVPTVKFVSIMKSVSEVEPEA